MDKSKLMKLAHLVLNFAEVKTDKSPLIYEGELAVGIEVMVEDEKGEIVAAPDGEYLTDTQKITVKDGKVEKIEEKAETEISEEFSRKLCFAEEGYNELMQKIAKAVGEHSYVVEAGDGWAIVSIWSEEEGEKFYRYTYSLDAEGKVLLGEREEVEPRFVTEEEGKKLEFEEVIPNEKDEKIAELEGLLKDRDAIIEELNAKIKDLESKLNEPAEEALEMSAVAKTENDKYSKISKILNN